MDGDTLLSGLKRGNYEVTREIRDYLKPALTGNDDRVNKARRHFAVKFLYTYTTDFDNIPKDNVAGVFDVVAECVATVHHHQPGIRQDLVLEKVLYHLFVKALKQGYLSESIRVAQLLHTCFTINGHCDEADIPKMAQSIYAALWNAAVHEERNSNTRVEWCLQLRHTALCHLILSEKALEIGQHLVTWTITRHSRGVSKMKLNAKGQQATCDAVCNMLQEVGQSIEARLACVKSECETLTLILIQIDAYLHLLNYLCSNNGSAQCTIVINQINSFLNRTEKTLSQQQNLHPSVIRLVSSLVETGVLLLKQSNQDSKVHSNQVFESVKKCSENFTLAMPQHVESKAALQILDLAVRFCIQLKEDCTSRSASPLAGLPQQGKARLKIYEHAAQFFEHGQKLLRKGDIKRHAHFLLMEVRTLQCHLQALVTQVEGLKDFNDASSKQELSRVQGLLKNLDERLHHGRVNTAEGAIPLDDLLHCGNLAYKFGRLCYYKGAQTEAEGFLLTSVTHLRAWRAHADHKKCATVAVWKKYEMLSDVQRRLGKMDKALQTVAEGLIVEPGYLSSAVDMWVRIKIDMAKTTPDQVDTRTLWDHLNQEKCSLSACEVLSTEMATYKKIRTRHHELVYAVISQLLEITTSDPVTQARTLLEKAQILWTTRKDGDESALECIQEAVKLLKECLSSYKTPPPSLQDNLARAYLWHHLVADIDPLQLRDELKKNKEQERPSSVSEGELDDEPYHDCCTVEMEHSALQWSDQALSLWERVAQDGPEDVHCVTTTLECLNVLAWIYRFTHRMSAECRSLQVLTRLASVHSQHSFFLQGQTQLGQLYCRLQQPDLASALVLATEQWLSKQDTESVCRGQQYISFLLFKVEAFLLNGQIPESCKALQEAVTFKAQEFKAKSPDSLTLDAYICRLTARLLSLPPSYHSNCHDNYCFGNTDCSDENGMRENALEMETKGTRSISGVVCFLMGEWLVTSKVTPGKVPSNTMSKWSLLDELLTSLLCTGSTYIQLGEAREAKCYLQQGLKLAQAFHVPHRFAAFHLELSRLDNLTSRYTESQTHLNVVSYILNNMEANSASIITTCPASRASIDGKENYNGDSDMIIKSLPIDIPGELSVDATTTVPGSPTARRWRPQSPASWQHGEDCDCDGCKDITVQGLHLLHLSQQADLLHKQGLTSQAEAFWHLLLKNFDHITNRAQVTLSSLHSAASHSASDLKNGTNLKKRKKQSRTGKKTADEDGQTSKPSMYQQTLVDVCLNVAELAVCQQNWPLYEEWVTKATELVDWKTYPWMTECHVQLARVTYLRVVPSLPWPKVSQKSDVEELCQRIGRVKIADQPHKVSPDSQTDPKPDILTPMAAAPVLSERTASGGKVTGTTTAEGGQPSSRKTKAGGQRTTGRIPVRKGRSVGSESVTSKVTSKVDNKTPQEGTQKETISKVPVPSTLHTPARQTARVRRNPKTGEGIGQDMTTPVCKPSGDSDRQPDYLALFKTPRSVSGRRAMLDLLIDSDDEDDVKITQSTRGKGKKETRTLSTKVTTQRKTRARVLENLDTAKKLVPPSVLSPSTGNTMKCVTPAPGRSETKSVKAVTKPKTSGQSMSPSRCLFRSTLSKAVALEVGNSENVYDFELSSPEAESRAALKGKKRPGKPGRKPTTQQGRKAKVRMQAEDIETAREGILVGEKESGTTDRSKELPLVAEIDDMQCATPMVKNPTKDCEEVGLTSTQHREKSMQPARRTGRLRLTRAKTSKLEGLREKDEMIDDSMSLSFEEVADVEQGENRTLHHCVESPVSLCGAEPTADSPASATALLAPASPFNVSIGCQSPVEMVRSDKGHTEDTYDHDFVMPFEEGCEEHLPEDLPGLLDRSIEMPRSVDQDGDVKNTSRKKRGQNERGKNSGERKKEGQRTGRSVVTDLKGGEEMNAMSGQSKGRSLTPDSFTDQENRDPAADPCLPPSDVEASLERAFQLLAHHPAPLPYRSICHAVALLEFAKPAADSWRLAYYLAEAQSVTFRHNAISNISRKLRKLKDDSCSDSEEFSTERARLDHMRSLLNFGSKVDDMRAAVKGIPDDTSVVQLTVLTGTNEDLGQLFITRMEAGQDPLTLNLPGFSTAQGQRLLREVGCVMTENKSTMELTNKVEWWSQRQHLDDKLKELMEEMEVRWLGCWLGMLLGWPENDSDETELVQATNVLTAAIVAEAGVGVHIDSQLVKVLLHSHHLLDVSMIARCLCHLLGVEGSHHALPSLLMTTSDLAKKLNLAASTKCRPVILILDKVVQHLPWESTPVLRGHPVTRVPSIHFLHAMTFMLKDMPDSLYNTGVNRSNTFYVLNPDDNLPNTQATFQQDFERESGWKGVVGRTPTSAEFTEAVTLHDLFIYCGHGSGAKFLPGEALASLRCRAAVLLMGCSSGKLTVDGMLEAAGMMLNYFLAGCPCIVACLWDVTDRDIDRFLGDLLERWLAAPPGTSLVDCVHQSRDACRLPYLIGAAPAVYGLPVHIKRTANK